MSLSAPMIDALLATGGTVEQLAAMVKADLAERHAIETARLEAKRAGNRERQQRKRGRNAPSRAVTPVTRDTPPYEDTLPPPKISPTKPSGLEPKPKKHRLPDDWQPMPFNPGTEAYKIVERWEPGRLERELAKFRAHYAAAGTRWENWQLVWCKWVNNSDDFQRGNNGHLGRHQSTDGLSPTTRAAARVFGTAPTRQPGTVSG